MITPQLNLTVNDCVEPSTSLPTPTPITCSAWEGGGVLGVAYIGAIRAMNEAGILQNLKCFAGTSAGSIVAATLSLGATPEYITDKLRTMNFESFLDNDFGFFRDLWRLFTRHGWNRGDAFLQWFGNVVQDLTGSKNTTFAQAHRRFGTTLICVVWNNSCKRTMRLSYKTHPDMEIRHAVRMSMSVPLLFQSCWLEVDGKRCEIQDGGVGENYPIAAFDFSEYCCGPIDTDAELAATPRYASPRTYGGNQGKINWGTIGFRLDTTDDDQFESHTWTDTSSLSKSVSTLVESLMLLAQSRLMRHDDDLRTVKIPCGNAKSLDFNISEATKDTLIEAGYNATKEFLERYHH